MKHSKQTLRTIILSLLIAANIFTFSACSNESTQTCQHQWIEATCTEPKTCKICNKTEGEALQHDVKWIITKAPTLINKGTEELRCATCDEQFDSQTVQKKSPKVEDDHFNFTDKELIEWLNAETAITISYTELDVFDDDSPNTCYPITWDDEIGFLILNHGEVRDTHTKNENINAIMVYFENKYSANSVAIWIGNQIDYRFDTEYAIRSILSDEVYRAADMHMQRFELGDDFIVTWLSSLDYALSLY